MELEPGTIFLLIAVVLFVFLWASQGMDLPGGGKL
jgi:hypothetical protein